MRRVTIPARRSARPAEGRETDVEERKGAPRTGRRVATGPRRRAKGCPRRRGRSGDRGTAGSKGRAQHGRTGGTPETKDDPRNPETR